MIKRVLAAQFLPEKKTVEEERRDERVRGVGRDPMRCDATVPKCAVKREVCSVAKRSVSTPRTYEVNS